MGRRSPAAADGCCSDPDGVVGARAWAASTPSRDRAPALCWVGAGPDCW